MKLLPGSALGLWLAVAAVAAADLYAQEVAGYVRPEYAGSFQADGHFREASKTARRIGPEAVPRQRWAPRPVEVPPWVNLHPIERVVEDAGPRRYSRETFHRKSAWAAFVDHVVTFAYGRQTVLRAPTHVVTDSRTRVIISDPAIPAVHVLDGDDSFRIEGGWGRRLQQPNGIAVDAADNIYVADGVRGTILVYDSEGRYLRQLGTVHGEAMFQQPTGIALDRATGHLYVLDSPSDELVLLDLEGNVLARAGGRRRYAGVSLDHPTEIAVGADVVVVLDRSGFRIQLLDLDCGPLSQFTISDASRRPRTPELALAVDGAGNVYVSTMLGSPELRVYQHDGELIDSLGKSYRTNRRLSALSGAWIDSAGRIYLADPGSSRVLVFERAPVTAFGKTHLHATRTIR